VLIAGVSIPPEHVLSDKKFAKDLIDELSHSVDVSVWTMDEGAPHVGPSSSGVEFTITNRIGHEPLYQRGAPPVPHPRHSPLRALAEVSVTAALRLTRWLAARPQSKPFDVVHLTDPMGPVIPLIRRSAGGAAITVSKYTASIYSGLRSTLYDRLIYHSVQPADRIVSFSSAVKEALGRAGVDLAKVTQISWGIPPTGTRSDEIVRKVRQRYGIAEGELFVVLSDRLLARKPSGHPIGQELVRWSGEVGAGADVHFFTLVRPAGYEDWMGALSTDRWTVVASPPDFQDVLCAADVYFAPDNVNTADQLLPPLLWFEAMGAGAVPVVRSAPNTRDLVQHGENGFVFESPGEAISAFRELETSSRLAEVSKRARETVEGEFNVRVIAEAYVQMWSDLVGSGRE
jgi:glycosyltransferase involved in cell wall biosynthesis